MPGTVVVTRVTTPIDPYKRGDSLLREIRIAWTADADDATVPDTSLGVVSGALHRLVTDPGAPAPTASYDITIVDSDGFDVLAGAGLNRHDTNTEEVAIPVVSDGDARVVGGTLTFKLAGNAVNSAKGLARLFVIQ